MGRGTMLLSEELLSKAEAEYKKIKEGKIARKLLAIMAYSRHSSEEVSKIFQIHRSTLFEWIKKFKEKGILGLKDKRGGNYPVKMPESKWEEIKNIVIEGKDFSGRAVNWTIKKLKLEIRNRCGIEYSEERIRLKLKEMGLVLRRPRVKHYKSSEELQESFKKNEGNSGIK